VRISRDHTGEQLGVTRQLEDARELARRRGFDVVAEYTDNDVSAAGKRRRPGFEALLADLAEGRADAVVAWTLDRITRNARDRLRLLDIGRERGIIVALVRGSDLDLSTPSGRLIADVLGSVAQNEIDVKADRQQRAARQRAERGLLPLGPTPYGYARRGRTVVVDEAEAPVVKRVVQQVLDGVPLYSIARELEAEGAPTRHGKPWRVSTVRGIAMNPHYAGISVYKGDELPARGQWPALIDEDAHRLVVAALSDPQRRTQKSTERMHLGSGLYRCGVCGGGTDERGALPGAPVSSWSGNRYRCKAGCITRVRPDIDETVRASIRAQLARDDYASLLAPDDATPEVHDLVVRARELRERLERFAADYDAGYIDGARYAAARGKAEAELAQVEQERARSVASGAAAAVLGAPDRAAAFDTVDLATQRAVVDTLAVVVLLPGVHGRKAFDPESVQFRWRADD
jgi:DNA invertase Pin-like site-specific DNA recombinase